MHISRIIAHIALATAIAATTMLPTDAAWIWTTKSTGEVKADRRNLVANSGLRGLAEQPSPIEVPPANGPIIGTLLQGDKQPFGTPMLPANSPITKSPFLNNNPLREKSMPLANNLVPRPPLLSDNQPLQTPMLPVNGPITGHRLLSGNMPVEPPMLPANSPITGHPFLGGNQPFGTPTLPADSPITGPPLPSGNIPSTFGGEQNPNEDQQNVDSMPNPIRNAN